MKQGFCDFLGEKKIVGKLHSKMTFSRTEEALAYSIVSGVHDMVQVNKVDRTNQLSCIVHDPAKVKVQYTERA